MIVIRNEKGEIMGHVTSLHIEVEDIGGGFRVPVHTIGLCNGSKVRYMEGFGDLTVKTPIPVAIDPEKMVKFTDDFKIFLEGAAAKKAGLGISDNPYVDDPDKTNANLWMSGYKGFGSCSGN